MKGNQASETKVRFYPSGMVEVLGGDPDEVALVGAAVTKGLFRNRSIPVPQPELPMINEPANGLDTPSKATADRSPFYDESVNQYHPAVQALEKYILSKPAPAKFEYHWMREFVGKEITGHWRECLTRAVGTLMARLVKSGVVSRINGEEWEKVNLVKK